MTTIAALVLTVVLAALVVVGALVVWRRPPLALPVFVVGLAIHNYALMVLIHWDMPNIAIRVVQSWKEGLLVLLGLRLVYQVAQSGGRAYVAAQFAVWRRSPRLVLTLDLLCAAFAVLIAIYVVMPSSLLGAGGPSISQRLISARVLGLIPALYACGRIWPPSLDANWRWIVRAAVGAGAVVAVLGLLELWFIPTIQWVYGGIIQFSNFQGYHYLGPGGLPENFFQSTTAGLAVRRMVSTYLSPLGIAYTALLVIPMAVALSIRSDLPRRRWMWLALGLIVVSLALSLTRLALACGAVEAVVLALLLRRRQVFLMSAGIVAAMALAIAVYPSYGPVVSWELADVRAPAGTQLFHVLDSPSKVSAPASTTVVPNLSSDIVDRAVSGQDDSIRGHISALESGARFVAAHPLGAGLGAAVPRYGSTSGPGESGLFQIGVEIGVLPLLLFSLLYGLLTLVGLIRSLFDPMDRPGGVLSLVVGVGGMAIAPIVLTSQLWGDFSVTFFFWWVAGAAVTAWSANSSFGPFRKAVPN